MDSREQTQQQAIQTLTEQKRLILNWATAMGKGTTAVKFVRTLPISSKILIVVAETSNKKNWKDEFKKFDAEEYLKSVTIICYASLHKYQDTEWDLIIFDEAHHLASAKRLSYLRTLSAEKVLVLSATLSNFNINVALRETFGTFTSMKVSLQDAIDNNYLPTPKIFLIPLELDDTKPNQTITIEWGDKKKRQVIHCSFQDRWKYMSSTAKKSKYPDVKLVISCTEQQKYFWLEENIDYYNKRFQMNPNPTSRLRWMRMGSERKRFMGEIKTNRVKKLIVRLQDKRFICFCSDVNQANKLGGTHAMHSKMRNPDKLLQDFNDGMINDLFVVGMLTEGQNLKNIEAGVIIQVDGVLRPYIQKLGRVLRAEDPVQYIFYFKNTQDEKYLNNALEGIDRRYITEYEY